MSKKITRSRMAGAQPPAVTAPVAQKVQRSPRALLRKHGAANIFGEASAKQETTEQAMKAFEGHQIQDPFTNAYGGQTAGIENILRTPYNPYALLRLPEENNALRQCIDAMVVNIESYGHRFEFVGEDGKEESKEAKKELKRLQTLLDSPNGQYSLVELRERLRRDYETFGYCFIEINRSVKKQIVSFYHVPAQTMRLTAVESDSVQTLVPLVREDAVIYQKVNRQFRRYVQDVNGKKVYFKEYGDPRSIDPETGQENKALTVDDAASEVYMLRLYTPGTAYGAPRYINQLPAILGSRESEIVNLNFFKQNTIPAMAILVAGGELTEDSVLELEEHIAAVQGRESIHRVLLLEAKGDAGAASENGTVPAPKVEMKSLVAERQQDAMFQEYDKNNQKKIRSSFRLPPLYVGLSEDTTYASAQTAQIIAEGQVFGAERNKIDDVFHAVLLADEEGLPPKLWRFRSNPPRITDPQTLINALSTLDQLGALTPNISIGIANELFDLHIPNIEEPWGDYPMKMVMAMLQEGTLKGVEAVREKPAAPEADAVDKLPVDDKGKGAAKNLLANLELFTRRKIEKKKAKIYVR